jgi:hypothetical protein
MMTVLELEQEIKELRERGAIDDNTPIEVHVAFPAARFSKEKVEARATDLSITPTSGPTARYKTHLLITSAS